MKLFDKMHEVEAKAAPIEKWTGSMNYPFNGHLDQPRPSLSKHEGTERGRGMLHCDDLIFILTARRVIPKLLKALDIATSAFNKIREENEKYAETSVMDWDEVQSIATYSLRYIGELNEDDGTGINNKKT
jgi:hypothetical protein